VSSPSALFPSEPVAVEELRESLRTPGRYRVVLSNGQEVVVGVQALADAGATRVGAVIAPTSVERLLHAAAVTALVDRAVNFLARGRRTRKELERRLARPPREGEPPARALVAEALDQLEHSGVLSDVEVAKAEAAARLRRGEAPARVRQTLRRKGVDGRSTDEAIAEAVANDGSDEMDACRLQAEKRWRSLAKLDPPVARRRLMAFLQRRGFGGQTIRAIVRELTRELGGED
jgi:regulatory protein